MRIIERMTKIVNKFRIIKLFRRIKTKVPLPTLFVFIIVLSLAMLLFYFERNQIAATSCGIEMLRPLPGVSWRVNMRRPNRGIATYRKTFMEEFNNLTLRKANALDARLIQLVRDVIDPPATEETLKMSRHITQTPQSLEVEQLLNKMVCLLFVTSIGIRFLNRFSFYMVFQNKV